MVIVIPLLLAPFLFKMYTVTEPGVAPLFQLKVTEVGDQLVAVGVAPPIRTEPGVVLGPNPPPETVNDLVVFLGTDDGYTPLTVGCFQGDGRRAVGCVSSVAVIDIEQIQRGPDRVFPETVVVIKRVKVRRRRYSFKLQSGNDFSGRIIEIEILAGAGARNPGRAPDARGKGGRGTGGGGLDGQETGTEGRDGALKYTVFTGWVITRGSVREDQFQDFTGSKDLLQ